MTLTFLRKGDLPHRFLPSVAVGLGLLWVAAAVHQGSDVVAKLFGREIPFQKGLVDFTTARMSNLGTGVYFVSLGKPNGICDLFIGNHRVATNRGILPHLRGKLLLGAAFRNVAGDVNIEVRCEREPGVQQAAGFSHTPILASYGFGIFIHGWRVFAETMFGPFASILLLCAILFAARSRSRLARVRNRWAYIAFGAASLAYTLAVADYPRLFFPSSTTAWMLVATAILFNLGLYVLCGLNSRVRMLVVDAHGVLFAAVSAMAAFWPEQFAEWTPRLMPLLAIATAISLRDLGVAKLESEAALAFRYLASAWLFAQLFQFFGAFAGFGNFFMPACATLVAVVTAIAYRRHVLRLSRLESTMVQVLRVVTTPLAPSAKLGEIASLISEATHFERASAYLDATVLGLRDKKFDTFVRVMERGYRNKETSRDRYVEFSEDRGGVMRKALEGRVPVLERGTRDGAWFMNLPVGDGACINLSDARPRADYLAYESFATLQRLLPSVRPLEDMLVPPSVKPEPGLEKLRDNYGLGTHQVEVGSIFVDVDDYDSNRIRFKDPYGLFIESIYFPALVRTVRQHAAREWTNRDELHLVCVSELLGGRSIATAVHTVISEVFAFVNGEGAELCKTHGYDPVSLHVGASWGKGRLVSATDFVRIDGEPVTRASTLQKAAHRGGALVEAALVSQWPKSGGNLTWEQATDEVAKATNLDAYRTRPDRIQEPRKAA